jgi:hypothetical protein
MSALQGFMIVVGLFVAGEATALAVGLHIVKKSKSPWVSLKNDLLLALDVVVGLGLIFWAISDTDFQTPEWFSLFVIIGLLTHIFRVWEYLAGRKNPFCGNRSLFIINNLKFVGLLIILVWVLIV